MVVAAYLCRMFHKDLSEVQRVKKEDLGPKDEPRVGLTSESTAKKGNNFIKRIYNNIY